MDIRYGAGTVEQDHFPVTIWPTSRRERELIAQFAFFVGARMSGTPTVIIPNRGHEIMLSFAEQPDLRVVKREFWQALLACEQEEQED